MFALSFKRKGHRTCSFQTISVVDANFLLLQIGVERESQIRLTDKGPPGKIAPKTYSMERP